MPPLKGLLDALPKKQTSIEQLQSRSSEERAPEPSRHSNKRQKVLELESETQPVPMKGIVKTVKETSTDYRFLLTSDDSNRPSTLGDSDQEVREFKLVKKDLFLERNPEPSSNHHCAELAALLGCQNTNPNQTELLHLISEKMAQNSRPEQRR